MQTLIFLYFFRYVKHEIFKPIYIVFKHLSYLSKLEGKKNNKKRIFFKVFKNFNFFFGCKKGSNFIRNVFFLIFHLLSNRIASILFSLELDLTLENSWNVCQKRLKLYYLPLAKEFMLTSC